MRLKKFNGNKDYHKLHHLPFNRNYKLRPSLVKSMQELGFIAAIHCCYTEVMTGTKELFILDGQHRALAAQYLDIEFYAVIINIEPTTKEELVNLTARYNNSSVIWALEIYVDAYISLDYEDYKLIKKYSKENNFSIKTIASILSEHSYTSNNSVANSIKDGSFKAGNVSELEATLSEVREIGVQLNNSMLLNYYKIRTVVEDFNPETFKNNFIANYETLAQSSYRQYEELFTNYCN